jgi:hypothetical protein
MAVKKKLAKTKKIAGHSRIKKSPNKKNTGGQISAI